MAYRSAFAKATARRVRQGLDPDQRQRLERDLATERNRARMERVAAIRFRAEGDGECAAACDERAVDAETQAAAIRDVLARFATPHRHSREGGNPRSTDSKRKIL